MMPILEANLHDFELPLTDRVRSDGLHEAHLSAAARADKQRQLFQKHLSDL